LKLKKGIAGAFKSKRRKEVVKMEKGLQIDKELRER
jgi:hypothetical protein